MLFNRYVVITFFGGIKKRYLFYSLSLFLYIGIIFRKYLILFLVCVSLRRRSIPYVCIFAFLSLSFSIQHVSKLPITPFYLDYKLEKDG